ncbi:MAG: hypothetical protein LBT85_02535 [Bifidobacteriaceae bacterium]|jgi:hypothetical protein|nr:hypothetical protein [Bifidobacteriaceae bacterium]
MLNFRNLNYRKNFFENKFFRNSKFRKGENLNLKKIGLFLFIWIFCVTLFLSGSDFAQGSTSTAALPISFGGTGATTQAGALTNLGINSTIDENSSNSTFPNAKAVYDYMNKAVVNCDNPTSGNGNISSDNTNFYKTICSWTGGDLIYKGSGLSTTGANNKIKVGGKDCTTSGQSYTSDSAAGDSIPQVGCVLPDLQAGAHAVTISTNGGSSYTINAGNVVYIETPALANCDTTSMQTFGTGATNCKAAMQQGQVIVLNDSRNNQKYRVKKMPGGNVWMIDNWKLGSTTSTTALTPADTDITSNLTLPIINNSYNSDTYNPSSTTYCSADVYAQVPGSLTGCGYMYTQPIICGGSSPSGSGHTACPESFSAKGWNIIVSNSGFGELSSSMMNAANNKNPVYSTTNYLNFSNIDKLAPWSGVYSGRTESSHVNSFANGTDGVYWTRAIYSLNSTYTQYSLAIRNSSITISYDARYGGLAYGSAIVSARSYI